MGDYIVRAISADGYVNAAAMSALEIVRRAAEIHHSTPTATAALGRGLTAASLMGNMQKVEEGSLTLQIRGGGPLGSMVCVSDGVGNVRGYVQNPQLPLMEKYPGKLDVGAAVGTDGMLTVIRDLQMKEPYVGSTALVSGEIAEDVTAYFAQSEQIPTACALGVLIAPEQTVQAAGGYLIQLLPSADDSVITAIEKGIAKVGAVSAQLDRGLGPVELLREVLSDFQLEILETSPVEYRCYCSRERVSRALISIGPAELRSLIEEQGGAELTCQFCDKIYRFSRSDLERLLQEATI